MSISLNKIFFTAQGRHPLLPPIRENMPISEIKFLSPKPGYPDLPFVTYGKIYPILACGYWPYPGYLRSVVFYGENKEVVKVYIDNYNFIGY